MRRPFFLFRSGARMVFNIRDTIRAKGCEPMTDFVKLTLDIRKRGVQDTIYLTAGDSNSRGVIVSLVADGTPFDSPSEAHVAMRIEPDQSLPADVIDGKIYHTFSLPVFGAVGEHLCEVKVYTDDYTILYSPKFSVIASEKLFDGDGELPEGGVSAVEQLINDTNDAKNRANSAADSAEIAVGKAEEAVESALEAVENANEANKSVASAIKNANDAAQTAKNEADNAKQMADKAEASALQADTAAAYANEEAENAKKEAANASTVASEAKDAAEGADDAALAAANKVAEIQQMLESGAFNGKDGKDGKDVDDGIYEKIAIFEGDGAVVEKQIEACKRIFVRMTLPKNTACGAFNIYAWHLNKVIGRAEIGAASANANYPYISTFEVFKSFGWWRTRFGLWTTNTLQVNTDKGRDYDYFVNEDAAMPTAVQYQYINKISTTKAIPAGTKIEIWGVKLSAEELAAIPATLEELEL